MFEKEDLTIKEVNPPCNLWCSSGHKSAEFFCPDDPNKKDIPTRFFKIKHANVEGIYCEPCLIVANHIAAQKKGNK